MVCNEASDSVSSDSPLVQSSFVQSIDHSLRHDHEACGNLNSMITPWCGDLRELKGGHYHRIVEITKNARNVFSMSTWLMNHLV
ncbi:hypothetical protein P8452_73483 [Trifolium repens]|nr:hypothetical protein P8452_73483 [Trifolium repens]